MTDSKCCMRCLHFSETTGECGKPLPSDPYKVFKPKRPDYHVCSMYEDIPPMPNFGAMMADAPEERYCCDCAAFRSPSTCLGCGPEITHIENPAAATTCKNFSKKKSPTIEELDAWIRNAEKQIEFWKKLKREMEENNG